MPRAAACTPFPTVDKCTVAGRGGDSIAVDIDGALLRGRSAFPYYALVAFEAGNPLRLTLLLLVFPLASLLAIAGAPSAAARVLIFVSTCGLRIDAVEAAARAVLPRHFAGDLDAGVYRVLSACRGSRRCAVTAAPRIFVESSVKEFIGEDVAVVGTELSTWNGRLTGLVGNGGVVAGDAKVAAVRHAVGEGIQLDVGVGGRQRREWGFLGLCKEAYVVAAAPPPPVPARELLPKPIIFHDGRLVQLPTPSVALSVLLWLPAGVLLSVLRMAAGIFLPMPLVYSAYTFLGVRVHVAGTPPPDDSAGGVLFACSHRTLLDPIFLSIAVRRKVTAVTYSLSRLSELLSPIRTVRLTRDRAADSAMITKLLAEGDLVVCPEGTTCREPFLLRFSALFAELTSEIVPVAMANRMSTFHGTTARGWKGLDPWYFFMNPTPAYEVTFLDKLPPDMTCQHGRRPSHDVANYVQQLIADALSFECTALTRKDKYRALAGNDGVVPEKAKRIVH